MIALTSVYSTGPYVSVGMPPYSFHYDIPGIEDIWGNGDTEELALEDLQRKIRMVRKALEMV